MALTTLLQTARDALAAQSYGLNVTGQNIANVATPGYARRVATLETRALGDQSYGSVSATELRRITDRFTDERLVGSTGMNAAAQERDGQLESIEALFNDFAGAGLGTSLDAMFSSFGTLAANPTDTTARDTVLERVDAFAGAVNRLAEELAVRQAHMLQAAQALAQQSNEKTAALADLNQQITLAKNLGHDAADLEEARDHVLLELAEIVDVETFFDAQGSLVVRGAGTTLVEGDRARTLAVDLAPGGTLRLLASDDGGSLDVTQHLVGGKLGGIAEARDHDLAQVFTRLDTFVFEVAGALNTQHALGTGLDGVGGRALFELTAAPAGAARALRLHSDLVGHPERVAAATAPTLLAGSDNAVALSALGRAPIAGGGTLTASEAYANLVGEVGRRRSEAQRALESREAIHAQLQAMREAMSGVSLDEEFVALTRFQRAYEASARVLTTADELLQELIQRI